MYVTSVHHVYTVPKKTEEGIGSLETGVIVVCVSTWLLEVKARNSRREISVPTHQVIFHILNWDNLSLLMLSYWLLQVYLNCLLNPEIILVRHTYINLSISFRLFHFMGL